MKDAVIMDFGEIVCHDELLIDTHLNLRWHRALVSGRAISNSLRIPPASPITSRLARIKEFCVQIPRCIANMLTVIVSHPTSWIPEEAAGLASFTITLRANRPLGEYVWTSDADEPAETRLVVPSPKSNR
jgi:hypothetical protein